MYLTRKKEGHVDYNRGSDQWLRVPREGRKHFPLEKGEGLYGNGWILLGFLNQISTGWARPWRLDTETSTMEHELKATKDVKRLDNRESWRMRKGWNRERGKSRKNIKGSFNTKFYPEQERKCSFVSWPDSLLQNNHSKVTCPNVYNTRTWKQCFHSFGDGCFAWESEGPDSSPDRTTKELEELWRDLSSLIWETGMGGVNWIRSNIFFRVETLRVWYKFLLSGVIMRAELHVYIYICIKIF